MAKITFGKKFYNTGVVFSRIRKTSVKICQGFAAFDSH